MIFTAICMVVFMLAAFVICIVGVPTWELMATIIISCVTLAALAFYITDMVRHTTENGITFWEFFSYREFSKMNLRGAVRKKQRR